jgi:CRISPR system Cascade subunit CasC
MLIQIHILQNYAPSNLNRDDTGSPKDAMFGGYRRGRISSQCLKRNIRLSDTFKEAFEKDGLIGFRTQRMPYEVSKELKELGVIDKDIETIIARLTEFGKSSKKAKEEISDSDSDGDNAPKSKSKKAATESNNEKVPETKQLIFLGKSELRPFAEKVLAYYKKVGAEKWTDKKATPVEDIEKTLGASVPRSVDIAMFGRMTTSTAFEDVHASVQVAHALSTNAISQEFDYYTAMDDLKPGSELGADMIGDVEFNSSTYYKYFNIHWEKLLENLGNNKEIACRAVLSLVEAAAISQPSGKQNSFAALNLPDVIFLEVSQKNVPVSYANAFLKPIYPRGDKTIMDASVDALGTYMGKVSGTYSLKAERAFTSTQEYDINGAETKDSLADLQKWLADKIGC